jgi:competence protein ComGC
MAAKGFRGSIILEILIVLMALLLIAVILIPNKIWKEEEKVTTTCQNNLNALYEAERFYYRSNEVYTDSLGKLLTFVQSDSGLNRRQTLVSLTNSLTKVLNNILTVSSVENISKVSLAVFEITGDLVGNDRYFRKYEELDNTREEIIREIAKFDSSIIFPNFSQTKIFVDSLRDLKETISDYSLQTATYRATRSLDSLLLYFSKIEKNELAQYWNVEYTKINNFITEIRDTDISKVSTVPDRLKKFIDQINTNIQELTGGLNSGDEEALEVERQNLDELYKKFLSPEFFMLTKNYSLTKLNETDSILISLSQDDFICPDAQKVYIFDTSGVRLTIECPNLLEQFQADFQESIAPIADLDVYDQVDQLKKTIDSTKVILDKNRTLLRRNTDILLKIKEIQAEFDQMKNVFFYRYVNEVHDFIQLVNEEKQLSILKPAIEDILNPLDTLAARYETTNVNDLELKLDYFNDRLKELDSLISETRLPSRVRRQIIPNAQSFQPAFNVLTDIENSLSPQYSEAFRKASDDLENGILEALEGKSEPVYIIFRREHKNHGYIANGEKSWEQEQ